MKPRSLSPHIPRQSFMWGIRVAVVVRVPYTVHVHHKLRWHTRLLLPWFLTCSWCAFIITHHSVCVLSRRKISYKRNRSRILIHMHVCFRTLRHDKSVTMRYMDTLANITGNAHVILSLCCSCGTQCVCVCEESWCVCVCICETPVSMTYFDFTCSGWFTLSGRSDEVEPPYNPERCSTKLYWEHHLILRI